MDASRINWSALADYHEFFLDIGFSVSDAELEAEEITSYSGSDASVLIVGCATGKTMDPFVKAGFQAFGIDSSPEMINSVENSCLQILAADGERLPFKEKMFDLVVVATGVLDSADDRESMAILLEIRKVIKSRSEISIYCHSVPDVRNIFFQLFFARRRWVYYRRYMCFCRFIQEAPLLRYLAQVLGRVRWFDNFRVVLDEPRKLREFAKRKKMQISWDKIINAAPRRMRLWREEDIRNLVSKCDLELKMVSFGRKADTRRYRIVPKEVCLG